MGIFDFIHKNSNKGAVKKVRIQIANLTAEELRRSTLPEEDFNIWIGLVSQKLNAYRLIYSNGEDPVYFPRVALDSDTASINNFKRTLNYIRRINQGRDIPQRQIYEDSGTISALIHEDKIPFTQKSIADLIEEYRKKFSVIKIPCAYYNVPESSLKNSGFPAKRIKLF